MKDQKLRTDRTIRFPSHVLRRANLAASSCDMSTNEFVCAAVEAAILTMAEHDSLLAAAFTHIDRQATADPHVSASAMRAVLN